MPNLKDLRKRIASVKSTQKITSAMKMVAAAKLRRAQERALAARPYAERMERLLASLAQSLAGLESAPPMLKGREREETHLVAVFTSNRGLCGGFNVNIVRGARQLIGALTGEGKKVKVLCVGSKGYDQMKRAYGDIIVDTITGLGKKYLSFADADAVGALIAGMFEKGEFDACTIIYSRFKSAISHEVTLQQVIPVPIPESVEAPSVPGGIPAIYEFEPGEEEILAEILPHNLSVQIFRALLENSASEQGARMTAMDSATRNAGEMIDDLTMFYNRSRQAVITNELIEIISGAEAL